VSVAGGNGYLSKGVRSSHDSIVPLLLVALQLDIL
jgi:hypothetical protein